MDWHLLPHATETLIAEVDVAAKGRFIGDPSYTYEHTEIRHLGEGDDTMEEEVMVSQRNTFRQLVTAHFPGNNTVITTREKKSFKMTRMIF